MVFKCVGCDSVIVWDGKGLFSYTCPCGARIWYNDENGALALPCSLIFALVSKTGIPHLEFLIGESAHTSPVKEGVTQALVESGAIWMKDCEQCRRDGSYRRKLEREKRIALLEAERIIGHGR